MYTCPPNFSFSIFVFSGLRIIERVWQSPRFLQHCAFSTWTPEANESDEIKGRQRKKYITFVLYICTSITTTEINISTAYFKTEANKSVDNKNGFQFDAFKDQCAAVPRVLFNMIFPTYISFPLETDELPAGNFLWDKPDWNLISLRIRQTKYVPSLI